MGASPILAPMSEVAGRMSVQAGAHCLEMQQGGRGILLSGTTDTAAGKVLILGGGVVGSNAAKIAVGMGAHVAVLDKSIECLQQLSELFVGKINTIQSSHAAIAEQLRDADLVIGAAMMPGAMAPKLVSEDMVKTMNAGAVLVDVAIDQGGCFATSRPTTHAQPTFVKHGVIHYCVSNIPGAVARTSTMALNKVTLPYVLEFAGKGRDQVLCENSYLREGLSTYNGKLTCAAVSEEQRKTHTEAMHILSSS